MHMQARTENSGLRNRRSLLRVAGATLAGLGMTLILNIAPAKAQDMSNGADNFYTSEKVTVQKVTFKNQYQMRVAGNLFIPKDLDRNTKNPALVVGHPMGAVKEQSSNLYATKMACLLYTSPSPRDRS